MTLVLVTAYFFINYYGNEIILQVCEIIIYYFIINQKKMDLAGGTGGRGSVSDPLV